MLATSPYFEYISTWYLHVYYVTLIYIIILIKVVISGKYKNLNKITKI